MTLIPRPEPGEYHDYYGRYIARVPGDDALTGLSLTPPPLVARLADLDPVRGVYRYAPEKWTVCGVLQHVIDTERVFAYRALRFARADRTPLPGYDEEKWAPYTEVERRTVDDLLAEFSVVRAASRALMRSLPPAAVTRSGVANDAEISVRALAWIILGHELHHLAILRERYHV